MDKLLQSFNSAIFSAALSAGFNTTTVGYPQRPPLARTRSKFKAWHDSECKDLQQQIRGLLSQHTPHDDPHLQALKAQYKKRTKQLLRKHKATVAMEQAQLWRKDRNAFWRSYKPHTTTCPFKPQQLAEHFNAKMNSPAAPPRQMEPSTPTTTQQAACTAIDITTSPPSLADVLIALKKMSTSSAGIDGIPSALLKPYLPPPPPPTGDPTPLAPPPPDATAVIAGKLQSIYKSISQMGCVPQQWQMAVLAPIYKEKGDPGDIGNYRPLSIPTVSCRIWSNIMNSKLMAATADILPDTMFGFRSQRNCIDPLFMLRHLADLQKTKQGKIFAAAFMDLSGAYDSVDRGKLFEKLQGLGLTEHTIGLFRSLYTNNQCIIKCQAGTSMPFSIGCGVRQGCPLSTTLFNLYIHDLHSRLTSHCPGQGVKVRRHTATTNKQAVGYLLFTDLGYADDISLLADNPQHLQNMLNCFHEYCTELGLSINPTKCEVVVFGRSNSWPRQSWQVAGMALKRASQFKYLGVVLHGGRGIKATVEHRLESMSKAQSCVYRRLRQMHSHREPTLTADLFDSISRAAGDYGCEVWSTPWLNGWHLHDCSLQRYHTSILKRCLGVKMQTSNLLTLFECGKYPLQVHWLVRVVKYWNKLVTKAAGSDLLTETLKANVHLGINEGCSCWSKELAQGLHLAAPQQDWQAHLSGLKQIDCKAIEEAIKSGFRNTIDQFVHDPKDPQCEHRSHCCYNQWMFATTERDKLQAPAYLTLPCSSRLKTSAARFRLNNAPIRCNVDHGLGYSDRICTRCNNNQVDNEYHVLFECAGLADVRNHTSVDTSLGGCTSMHEFMQAAYQFERASSFVSYVGSIMSWIEEGSHRHTGSNAGQM